MTPTSSVRKALTANDLGLTGTHQAGILIPKVSEVLAFFPRLDEDEYNPDIELSVKTPATNEWWEIRFVYNNNKLHGCGTRNEYRLTRTGRMLIALGAAVGDEVIFSRDRVGDFVVSVEATGQVASVDDKVTMLSNGWSVVLSKP